MADLKKSELKVEGLESLRLVMAKALQGINKFGTDKKDPTDYMNVRLTDGKEFYNAISRSIASAMEGTSNTPFLKNDGVTPARVVLNADGSLPTSGGGGGTGGAVTATSGTFFANVVNFPNTIQIIDVTPSGVTNYVSVDNFPTNTSVISSSGTFHSAIDNFPTVQSVNIVDFQDGTRIDIKPLGTQVVTTDNGLVTNTVMHGLSTGGFGGYVDVKVNPSGALTADVSNSTGLVLGTGSASIGTVGTTSAVVNVGQKTSATSATQISSTSTVPTNGIIVQALSTNTASVYVGGSGVISSTGFELQSGQSISFTANLNTLYVVGSNSTDKVCWNVQ
jgi:hypothetical protein